MTSHATADRRVLGRYVLGRAIGRGATSVVHRADDVVTGDVVAVKVVPVELDLGAARARRGARGRPPRPPAHRRAARLGRGQRVPLPGVGAGGGPLAGRDAARAAGARRRDDRPRIGEDVLSALAHAHARGVVHRDVKPANILIGPDGRARLSDFGVARLSGESGLTMTGGVVGTVAYMAPEQAVGDVAGPEADVYSACLVLYEGFTGVEPGVGAEPGRDRPARGLGRRPVAGARAARPAVAASRGRSTPACAGIPRSAPRAADLADDLSALRGGVRAARRRGVRALPAVASAAGGAGLAAVALTTGRRPTAATAGSTGPRPSVAAAVVAGSALAFAWRPRAAALAAVAVGALLVGPERPGRGRRARRRSPSSSLLSGWRFGRLTLAAAAGPALFAAGLGLLVPALAGLVPRWPARLWTALRGRRRHGRLADRRRHRLAAGGRRLHRVGRERPRGRGRAGGRRSSASGSPSPTVPRRGLQAARAGRRGHVRPAGAARACRAARG